MNKIFIGICLAAGSIICSCHQFKNKELIDVRYELANNDKQLIWNLNDGKYSYLIQYHYNSKKNENQLSDEDSIQIVDSITTADEKPITNNYKIKHHYKALANEVTKNEVEFIDLIVSNELHYYYAQTENFTMPYEINISDSFMVKANIEAGKNFPLEISETDYAGSYNFKLEPRDVMLYRMIESKLSKESIKTDTISDFRIGHQIVIDNNIIINNPKSVYENKEIASIIMFTDYIILKYIPELQPEKFIYPINTKRKAVTPK